MIMMILVVFATGCQKDYDLKPDSKVPDTEFLLKATGAIISGDTAYAKPNTYVKWYVDELPLAVNQYLFNWTLGNGVFSTAASPEASYPVGLYAVSVVITPIAGGQAINRSIWLKVGTQVVADEAIILINSVPSGSNYVYTIGMDVQYITGYTPISGSNPGFISGDFTDWSNVNITQTQVIGGRTYIVYALTLSANNTQKQFWGYGQGNQWGYAPNSLYWVVTNSGGIFAAYFNNGIMSVNLGGSSNFPGDGGDEQNGEAPPTIRNQIVYASPGVSDTLVVHVNYGAYANGPVPFASRITTSGPENVALIPDINYPGWGYKKYPIGSSTYDLRWRFGANIYSPELFGVMNISKYYQSTDNLLEIQVIQTDNLKGYEVRMQKMHNSDL